MKREIPPHQINYYNVNCHQKKAYANFKDVKEFKAFVFACNQFEGPEKK